MAQPTLHVIAGPNGAGKSSVYESHVHPSTNAEFVNADLLAKAHFGKVATTLAESEWGQMAAEERRRVLMEASRSLVVESTFSHPSKLQLLRDARQLGYRLVVSHVNVANADLAVARVALRVTQDGHPVPEEKIRGRYVRNQEIIKAAVIMADHALVLDNSLRLTPPRPYVEFHYGVGRRLAERIPAWVESLYGPLLP